MPADITLVNLNMLFMRYGEEVERELHVPLGPLYLDPGAGGRRLRGRFPRLPVRRRPTSPSTCGVFLDFLRDPAPVIGLSCMANLLPFTVLAMRALREAYPDRTLVLGGVGSKAVEEKLLTRFPWVDIICRGEAEQTGPELLRRAAARRRPGRVPGMSLPHATARCIHTPDRPRITRPRRDPLPRLREGRPGALRRLRHDDQPRLPVPLHVLLGGPGVEPARATRRSPTNIVDEMEFLHREAGVGPVPVPGRVLRLRQAAGDGVLPRAASAAAWTSSGRRSAA